MSISTCRLRAVVLSAALGSLLLQAGVVEATAKKKDRGRKSDAATAHAGPDSVVLFIGNRMFPDFGEIVSTRLRQRQPVGDSDYWFEVVSFNPHFSIIDSTRTVVALSDEPKNPAFRIRVFRQDAAVDSTWAFYNLNIPHFSRTSALWFQVLCFDYRGTVYRKEPPDESGRKNPDPDAAKDR
jgi:hypothetical protein